jgi:hypothetical protein
MKRAVIRQRRTDRDGRRLINIVCPVCDRRHWLPDAAAGDCPRRPGQFVIAAAVLGRLKAVP